MNWFIKVRDTIYGPYSLSRMQHFAAEGRVSTRTLVSDNRDSGFGPAANDPELTEILAGHSATPPQAHMRPVAATPRVFAAYVALADEQAESFSQALSQFGPVLRPFGDVWLVKGDTSVEALRNVLTRELGSEDHLVVFEVNEGHGAWFNIGRQADRQIRVFFGGGNPD